MSRPAQPESRDARERRRRLADAMLVRRTTQGDLARRLGCAVASISRWIDRDDPQPQPGPAPSRVTTAALAEALDVPVDVLTPGARVALALVDDGGRVIVTERE